MKSHYRLSHALNRIVIPLLFCISALLIIIFGVVRYRLGIIRYFDMDEFGYLNWASHVASGYRPYIDFMFYPSPLYFYVLAPLTVVWRGVEVVFAGRTLAFAVFVILMLASVALYWEFRRNWVAILVALILLVLPLPSDKFIEIRPDTSAILFIIMGLFVQLRWMREGKEKYAFWTGFWFSLGVLFIQKAGALAAVSIVFMLGHGFFNLKNDLKRGMVMLVCGLALPWFVLALWAIVNGNPGVVAYSILRLPFEVTFQQKSFNQVPSLFYFQPNSIYYGVWGYGWGLYVNTILWISGIILAIARLVTLPFIKSKLRWIEAFIPVLLLSQIMFYMYASPLKHPQYLIPAAVFTALLVTDGIYTFWRVATKTNLGKIVSIFLYCGILYVMVRSFDSVNTPKFSWTNDTHIMKIRRILGIIPKGEYVLDLEGRTLFYPYPSYYGCCMAFGQMESPLTRKRPSLSQELLRTRTKYIYQAEINRIAALSPEDSAFIYQHYSPTENGELWVSHDW